MNFVKCYNNSLKLLEEIRKNEVIVPEIFSTQMYCHSRAYDIIFNNPNISSVRYLVKLSCDCLNLGDMIASVYIPEHCDKISLREHTSVVSQIPTDIITNNYTLSDILIESKKLPTKSLEPEFYGQEEIFFKGTLYKKINIQPFSINLFKYCLDFHKYCNILVETVVTRLTKVPKKLGIKISYQKFILNNNLLEKIEY